MKKIMMVILDGFGYREEKEGNAILNADMSNYMALWDNYPHTTLYASEDYIGLNTGQFGNSEIGHMTIGAGEIIKNNTKIVDDALREMPQSEVFADFVDRLNENQKPLHLIGLLSDGNVHSSLSHWLKFIDVIKNKIKNPVYVHIITDGRDTDPHSAASYINAFKEKAKELKSFSIASICGRYYAMDRDKKWDRTKVYYDAITRGLAISIKSEIDALNKSYENDITDEFIKPFIIDKEGLIKDGDNIMWMNYREDRAVQLLESLTNPNFDNFRTINTENCNLYTFLPFESPIKSTNFTNYIKIDNPLGVYLSKLGLTQARIAETEKYAHVTYFFDGESNASLANCQKYLIPSPKVATYDLKPEMSAVEITKKCVACLEKDYDFILMNFANADMVGHTGKYEATVNACLTLDVCLKLLKEKCDENFYTLVITADHGNADCMIDEKGHEVTTHTTSLVPFIITDKNVKLKSKGDLTNIAPTILKYMDIAVPKEMEQTKTLIMEDDD